MSSPLSAPSSPLSPITIDDLAKSLRRIIDSAFAAPEVERSRELLQRYDAQQAEESTRLAARIRNRDANEPEPECTGLTAVWCPNCGDCTCDLNVYGEHDLCTSSCRLHGTPMVSHHARQEQTEPSKPAPETKQLKVWQYDLPSIKGEGWAKVIIREDGFFSAVSDWGNFAFTWGSTGPGDVREFFLRMERDWDYFASKFDIGRGYHPKTDSDASADALKREVLRLRRARELTREQAAEDWENFDQYGDDWESLIRAHWNSDDEPWRFAVFETSDAVWFVKKIGPRLVEAIRKQLAEESAAATARSEPSKPALSEVEKAAVNVVNAYHGCGEGAYDAHSLPDAVFALRDALKRIGAL